MKRYFMDTEFLENGVTIRPISIGIVSDDGREFYAEFRDVEPREIIGHPWLFHNVAPHLDYWNPISPAITLNSYHRLPDKDEIAWKIKEFLGDDRCEIWCYFGDYDWVLFAQLFGRMVDMPHNLGFQALDLMQLMKLCGLRKGDVPKQSGNQHNALDDARWNRDVFNWIHDNYEIEVKRKNGQ